MKAGQFIRTHFFRGLCVTLYCAASGFGAGAEIKGRVTTNDGFPGSNLIVSLKATGVRDTTDTAGSFSLPVPGVGVVKDAGAGTQGRSPEPSVVLQLSGNTQRYSGQNDNYFDLSGKAVDLKSVSGPLTGTGLYIRQTLNKLSAGSSLLRKDAQAFSDTIIISYCDSVQKKQVVLSSDFGKTLQITLVNDLAPKGHRFLAASYSNNAAFVISTTNTLETTYKMPGPVQDAWKLANGNILLSGGDSVKEVDAAGKFVWGYKASCGGEMHNCQPLPGGKRFFGENCSGKLFINDGQGTTAAVPNIQLKDGSDNNHSRFRMARKYDSLFLVTAKGEETVYMFNSKGDILRKIDNSKLSKFGVNFNAVHSAILLPGGNLLIASGYSGFFIEVDKKDSVVWKVNAADLPGIGLTYAAGCQRLHNGNTICSAYQSTVKFFEITHQKHIVWKSNAGGVTGNPTHVFLLDVAGDPSKGELLR
jgi:hypothetical protein